MTKRKKIKLLIAASISIVLAVFLYYQFFYRSPVVDKGIAKLVTQFKGHKDIVMAVKFGAGDSTVVTAGIDSTIKVWNTQSGEILLNIKQPAGITSLDLSADGRYAVTSGYDAKVRTWDLTIGKLLHEFGGHKGTVWTVAFSRDDKLIASAGEDKIVRIWDLATGSVRNNLEGHTLNIWAVKFSPVGGKIASAGFDQSFRIWDVTTGKLLMSNNEHSQAIVDLAFSHDGKRLVTTSDDKTIRTWNLATGAMVRIMEVAEHIQAIAFSPDDKMIITGGRDKPVIGELLQNFMGDSEYDKGISARLWNMQTGELLQTFSHHGNDVNDVAFSHNGKWIATASADHTVEIWSLSSF